MFVLVCSHWYPQANTWPCKHDFMVISSNSVSWKAGYIISCPAFFCSNSDTIMQITMTKLVPGFIVHQYNDQHQQSTLSKIDNDAMDGGSIWKALQSSHSPSCSSIWLQQTSPAGFWFKQSLRCVWKCGIPIKGASEHGKSDDESSDLGIPYFQTNPYSMDLDRRKRKTC